MRFLSILAIVSVAIAVEGAGAKESLNTSACVTHADTTAWPLEMAKHDIVEGDSASLVNDGLPYPVASVTVVADEEVCSAVVQGYNNLIPQSDSVQRISRGIVIQAGPVYVLALPPERPGHLSVLYFFNSSYAFITRHESPQESELSAKARVD